MRTFRIARGLRRPRGPEKVSDNFREVICAAISFTVLRIFCSSNNEFLDVASMTSRLSSDFVLFAEG